MSQSDQEDAGQADLTDRTEKEEDPTLEEIGSSPDKETIEDKDK